MAQTITPSTCEDALLLREYAHRALNDLAVAGAAVALARRTALGDRELAALDAVRARLDATGATMRLLAEPTAVQVDVGTELDRLIRAMAASRHGEHGCRLELDLPATSMDGGMARRVLLIAAEFASNAFKHALAGGGTLSVKLASQEQALVLEIADDGPGFEGILTSSGTGLGRGIVAELAALAGGTATLRGGPRGSVARLVVPSAQAASDAA